MSAWPVTVYPKQVKIGSLAPGYFSLAPDGHQQSRSRGAHFWLITLTYPPRLRADLDPIFAFANSLLGRQNTCTVVPGYYSKSARGTASGSPTGAGSAGASSVTVSGLSGTLLAGDFVKFNSHSKVYQVTADRSGNGAMSIAPNLIADASGAITFDDVPFTCRLISELAELDSNLADIYGATFKLMEAY